MNLADIEGAVAAIGMTIRGGFHPLPEDRVPDVAEGYAARTLLFVGNVGPAMWNAFGNSGRLAARNPLDTWTRNGLSPLAERLGARAVFPFDGPPYHPFQRWAQRAESVYPSPAGPLIHPEFGLWHAYRGAIVLDNRLVLPERAVRPNPCDTCVARPCLTSCPVGAVEAGGYDTDKCVQYLASDAGRDCREHGCLARRACPVGRSYTYGADQARFHMAAFIRSRNVAG